MIAGGGRATPLFLVHDGLGEILLYRTLATRIGDERPIYGLQPEVRADGSFIHTAIATMAAAHIVKIRQVQPKGPYLLAGLCAGGVIAFEMARQLEDLGEAVWYVGIIDAADVEARERPFFVARLRLKRFAALLTVSRLSDLATVSREITAKAWRFLRYEHEDWRHRRRMQRQVNDLRAPRVIPPLRLRRERRGLPSSTCTRSRTASTARTGCSITRMSSCTVPGPGPGLPTTCPSPNSSATARSAGAPGSRMAWRY
ncbi:thioesterase domain-containing protein [Sphingomonas aurantiaca]